MKSSHRGRPSTRPPELREGYYFEVKSKGASSGIKIVRDTMKEVEFSLEQYNKTKVATYIGQVKDGRWVDGKYKGKKTN